MKAEINYEDYENSTKQYMDPLNCPASIAVNRLLGFWGTITGHDIFDFQKGKVGSSSVNWDYKTFAQLRDTKQPFITELTIFEPEKQEPIKPRR